MKLLSIVLIPATCCLVAAQNNPVPTTDHLRIAQDFLRTFYPDLTSKDNWMTLTSSVRNDGQISALSGFELDIGAGPKDLILHYVGGYVGTTPPKDYHEGPVYPKQFLTSGFQFDGNRIKVFNAMGPAVGNLDAENQFIDFVLSHPQMSDAEINTDVREAGAKYALSDKGEFVKQLRLNRFEPFLGRMEMIAVSSPPLEENRSNLALWLTWTVNVSAKQPNGAKLKYELTFEQFKGDLISLAETSNPSDKNN